MSFKDWTPEQRREARAKAAATRSANATAKAARKTDRGTPLAAIAEEIVGEEVGLAAGLYGSAVEHVGEEAPLSSVDPADPFQLFLVSIDAETRDLLGMEELGRIYAEQLAKALAEKRKTKRKAAEEAALNAARMEAGLVPAATVEAMAVAKRNAEIVTALIELPPAGEHGEIADIGLRIDGVVYLHGMRYQMTRAQWDSRREMLYRAAQHELEFQGQNMRRRRWMLGRAMGLGNVHIPLNPDGSPA
jgi:hypothetical protein